MGVNNMDNNILTNDENTFFPITALAPYVLLSGSLTSTILSIIDLTKKIKRSGCQFWQSH